MLASCGAEADTTTTTAAPTTTTMADATTTTSVDTTTAPSAECDASALHWSPEGLREAVLDASHIDEMELMNMDRGGIEEIACGVASRIEAEEPPMELFESLVARWSDVAELADYRVAGWDVTNGRYRGLTPAQCAQMTVVATLIVNTDTDVLGNFERQPGFGGSYIPYTAVCDG